ncbi:hypothetical protein FE36_15575 [Xanthomonas oryzae pv. oryzicola]|nr:hypothetical protein BE73_17455 [Xanthomonas oryzae pv. oryzicola]AKK65118.1 hypothetical protein FE36_15575 [Xanthomonas oryzae pv. oryzicola]
MDSSGAISGWNAPEVKVSRGAELKFSASLANTCTPSASWKLAPTCGWNQSLFLMVTARRMPTVKSSRLAMPL